MASRQLLALDRTQSDQVVKDARKIQFNEQQEKVFELVAKGLIAAFSDTEPIVIRGLLRLSVRDWQVKNQVTMPEVDKWPLEKRLQVTKGILEIFGNRFYRILRLQTEQAETLIKSTLNQVFSKYVEFAQGGYKDPI